MIGLGRAGDLEVDFGREIERAEAEIAAIDPKWKDAERQAAETEIRAALAARRGELDAEHAENLDKAVQEAGVTRYRAELATGPQTPAEWAEAQARASFVAQDVGGLEPAELVKRCALAREAGDQVGAWLIAREGLQRLGALRESGTFQDGLALSQAISKLENAILGEASAGYKADMGKIQEARAAWARLQSRAADRRGPSVVKW